MFTKFFRLNAKGQEIPDPTPIEVPIGFNRPPTIQEQIAKYVQSANLLAQQTGYESFEEAEDFDVGDDLDPSTPYELDFDHTTGREVYKQQKEELDKYRSEFDAFVRNKKKKEKAEKKADKKEKSDLPKEE